MAKKRKAAANKRGSRKRPARGRASADQTVNTLVILVVIVIVLGGLYLYAQNNKKQAALLQSLSPALATITAPLKAVFTRVIAVTPAAQPATQQTLQLPEPAAGPDERQPVALIEAK